MAADKYAVDPFVSDQGRAIFAAFLDIARNGWDGLTDVRSIAPKLWEIKVHQHRVFYTAFGQEVVLLHAYKKQSGKAPTTEIRTAKARLATETKRRGVQISRV